MSQIQKKFIKPDAVDETKILLSNDAALRAKNAEGSDVSLFKLDSAGKLQLLVLPQVSSDPVAGSDIVRKSHMDSQISSAVSGASSDLSAALNTERERIDAILSASTADKDSFAEIVSLINSVDTENDTAFGAYVVSNNAALAQEVSDRGTAVSAEQTRAEGAEAGLQSAIDQEIIDRQSAVSAEQTRAEGVEATMLLLDGTRPMEGDLDMGEHGLTNVTSVSMIGEGAASISASGDLEFSVSGSLSFAGKVLSNVGVGTEYTDAATRGQIYDLEEQIGNEVSQRIGAVEAEATRALAAEAALGDAISSEASARALADTGLSGEISVERGRIDAILLASDADKDSFAEIVSLINSIDTENDSAFGAYVISNNAALAAEVSARGTAVSAEQTRAEAAEAALQALVDSLEAVSVEFVQEKFVLDSAAIAAGYVTLGHLAYGESINAYVDRLAIHKTDDYTISVVGGVSRLTFVGSLVGEEALAVGDVVRVKYAKVAIA